MNAVVFADGWLKGGRDGARQGLADFWTEFDKQRFAISGSRVTAGSTKERDDESTDDQAVTGPT